jgi:hypothetical protein
MEQQYKNHVRYYAPHHFVFYPILLAAFAWSLYKHFTLASDNEIWLAIAIVFFMIGWLSFMLRQHYALNNQNRIVRLELRFRYFVLTNEKFDVIEEHLSFKQLVALRFAPDEELIALIDKAISEDLSPDAIKRNIKKWRPDTMRV